MKLSTEINSSSVCYDGTTAPGDSLDVGREFDGEVCTFGIPSRPVSLQTSPSGLATFGCSIW